MRSNENHSERTGRSSTRPEETRRRDRDDRSLSPPPGYDDIPRDVFNIYKCTTCKKGFGGSKFQLESHNAIYHQNPDQWLYKCRRPGCSRKFPTAHKRDAHEGRTGRACVVGTGTKDDPLDLDAPPTRRGGFDDKRATKANETSRHFLGKSKYDWMN